MAAGRVEITVENMFVVSESDTKFTGKLLKQGSTVKKNHAVFWAVLNTQHPVKGTGNQRNTPASRTRNGAFPGDQVVSGCAPDISPGRFSGADRFRPSKRTGN